MIQLLQVNFSINFGAGCKGVIDLRAQTLVCGFTAENHTLKSVPPLRCRLPTEHCLRVSEIVELQINLREDLGHHNNLTGVHRKGKRNHNRFPFFRLDDGPENG